MLKRVCILDTKRCVFCLKRRSDNKKEPPMGATPNNFTTLCSIHETPELGPGLPFKSVVIGFTVLLKSLD